MYGFAVEPLLRLRVARYDLRLERWPPGFNLTIAAVADLHACRPWMTPERIQSIVDLTNSLRADVIVLLGDYVTGHRFVTGPVDAEDWARALSGLRAPLGVHAVLGNHDWWDDRAVQRARRGPPYGKGALEAVGIPVYENEAVRLGQGTHAFWLAGLGDQLAFCHAPPLPDQRSGSTISPARWRKVTDDAPVILLAHEPDIIVRVPERVA